MNPGSRSHPFARTRPLRLLLALLAAIAMVAAACGGDDESVATGEGEASAGDADDETSTDDGAELPNACPAEGCKVTIAAVEAADGGELQITFDANYSPDFERNHIHVYWDVYEAGSVSSNFQEQGYDVQGKWHPTDEYPVYVTQADAAVSSSFREGATTVCVTAADTDHVVIDASIVHCEDVTDLLS